MIFILIFIRYLYNESFIILGLKNMFFFTIYFIDSMIFLNINEQIVFFIEKKNNLFRQWNEKKNNDVFL